MSKNLKETIVFLPAINPGLIRATSDWSETDAYWVIDRRPKVGEYYINMFIVERERSIQNHPTLKALRNHQRDYRFKFCCVVTRTTNLKYSELLTNGQNPEGCDTTGDAILTDDNKQK